MSSKHDCVCLHGPGYRPKECECSVYVDQHGAWCGNENCRVFLGNPDLIPSWKRWPNGAPT